MEVKVKKLVDTAIVPTYAKLGDAGLDLTATSFTVDKNGCITYGTGLAIEIPEGHVGLIFPRSSISKTDLVQKNAVGVVDSGYRGEIMVKHGVVYNEDVHSDEDGKIRPPMVYDVGDRVAQLLIMPYPQIKLVEVEELSETDRGEGGFGSTGK